MDAKALKQYLREGIRDGQPEPSGDGGFLVPQPYVDMIYASMRCQSSWLSFFRRIWWKITAAKPYLFPIRFAWISETVAPKLFWITSDEDGYGDEPYDALGYWIDDMGDDES